MKLTNRKLWKIIITALHNNSSPRHNSPQNTNLSLDLRKLRKPRGKPFVLFFVGVIAFFKTTVDDVGTVVVGKPAIWSSKTIHPVLAPVSTAVLFDKLSPMVLRWPSLNFKNENLLKYLNEFLNYANFVNNFKWKLLAYLKIKY